MEATPHPCANAVFCLSSFCFIEVKKNSAKSGSQKCDRILRNVSALYFMVLSPGILSYFLRIWGREWISKPRRQRQDGKNIHWTKFDKSVEMTPHPEVAGCCPSDRMPDCIPTSLPRPLMSPEACSSAIRRTTTQQQ